MLLIPDFCVQGVVGTRGPEGPESGFQNRSGALALSARSSNPFISMRRVNSGSLALYFGGRSVWRLLHSPNSPSHKRP